MLTFEGCNFFRQRLVLSTLSGKAIKIIHIRDKDEQPGLTGILCFEIGTRVHCLAHEKSLKPARKAECVRQMPMFCRYLLNQLCTGVKTKDSACKRVYHQSRRLSRFSAQ